MGGEAEKGHVLECNYDMTFSGDGVCFLSIGSKVIVSP